MAMKTREFSARPAGTQECIICNLPWCCRHPPTGLRESEEEDGRWFEYTCLECGRVVRVGFRLDLSDLG